MKGKFNTDRGQVREKNEDAGGIFVHESGQVLAIIADGMGGHQAGNVASNIAITKMEEMWKETTYFHLPEDVEKWIKKTIDNTNQAILTHSSENEECKGMGTTIVLAVCTKEFLTVAHIGDSRCYISNDQGFTQITQDHSLVNELVRTGQITLEDAMEHPRKNVLTKALGTQENICGDIKSLGWEENEKILLCSDGLTNKITNDELADFIQSDSSIEETTQQLIDLANERGGEDNISLIIMQNVLQDEVGETS